jgi:hypothetical protein
MFPHQTLDVSKKPRQFTIPCLKPATYIDLVFPLPSNVHTCVSCMWFFGAACLPCIGVGFVAAACMRFDGTEILLFLSRVHDLTRTLVLLMKMERRGCVVIHGVDWSRGCTYEVVSTIVR